ncbi:hypothetical protein AB0M28_02930 [Streptomyces sp. NPDC051940]|uniref:hypothetical protein n=1 Tax=Streptomyces sp. NPDC051940 TaxID=3155675 RepID=UPI00343F206A
MDATRVGAFVADVLDDHELGAYAVRIATALAADTRLNFDGRPCEVAVLLAGGTLRITVTAILPESPGAAPSPAGVVRPMDLVRGEGVRYGSSVSQLSGTSTVWAELPWGAA